MPGIDLPSLSESFQPEAAAVQGPVRSGAECVGEAGLRCEQLMLRPRSRCAHKTPGEEHVPNLTGVIQLFLDMHRNQGLGADTERA